MLKDPVKFARFTANNKNIRYLSPSSKKGGGISDYQSMGNESMGAPVFERLLGDSARR